MDDQILNQIEKQIEEFAIKLMNEENKDYCLAKISKYDWRFFNYEGQIFVLIPSLAFKRFILNRQYLNIVDTFPEKFGKGNDWNIIEAFKEYDKDILLRQYSNSEYLDYLKGETMAYVFKIEQNSLSNRVLRLDLCRGINDDGKFFGGIFHVLKHFTIEGYDTLSSNNGEYVFECWNQIYHKIINNFFSINFTKEKNKPNKYIAISTLNDGHILRGVYHKKENMPLYFIDSMRICDEKEIILNHAV